ncbi:MAG: ATP-binding cassette domain-containing protein [Nitrososphaerales archaeon]
MIESQEPAALADDKTIVKVEGLSKTYDGKFKAVDSVSFEVKQGEIFGFLGPNGAGKSTTINMLTTLLPPTSGKAEVCGFDVHKHANEVRRNVGVVPQDYTADEDMTGLENILLCADLYGLPRSDSERHAVELLQLVELVQTRAAVWKYIRQLKQDYNMTLFVTTHYLEEADSLCDRIAIIDHGHIVKIGTPEELKATVGGDVIIVEVKESEPDISSDIGKLGLVKGVTKTGSEYRIKADSGETATPEIIDVIRSKGLHVSKISLTRPTLDEAYLELTGRTLREEETNRWAMMGQRRTMRTARS